MNICEFIIKNKIPHTKLEDGRIQQNCALGLSNNQISSLDGFVQTDTLVLYNNKIKNTKTTFINPKTDRVVFKMNEDWFGCGCFVGNKQQLKETCLKQGFLEIIEYFNL